MLVSGWSAEKTFSRELILFNFTRSFSSSWSVKPHSEIPALACKKTKKTQDNEKESETEEEKEINNCHFKPPAVSHAKKSGRKEVKEENGNPLEPGSVHYGPST